MSYRARLINRFAQFGKVEYDVLVEDDAGILPAIRRTINLPQSQDTNARRLAIRQALANEADAEQTVPRKRQRLRDMLSEVNDRIRSNAEELERLQRFKA